MQNVEPDFAGSRKGDQMNCRVPHPISAEFTAARSRRDQKDTPAHRADLTASLERVDAVLDVYLVVHGTPR